MSNTDSWINGRDPYWPQIPLQEEYLPFWGRYWVKDLNPFSHKCDYVDAATAHRHERLFLQLTGEGWPCIPPQGPEVPTLDDANELLRGIAAVWVPEQPGHFYGDISLTSWCSAANFSQRFDLTLFPLLSVVIYTDRSHSIPPFKPDYPSPYDFNRALEALYSRVLHRTKCCEQARLMAHPAGWQAPPLP